MSIARARANHALYLGKIVIEAWRRELAREDVPAGTLAQAFHTGVHSHLVAAYGWLLLAVSPADVPPQGPPRCCAELPPMPAGRLYPPEINEFRQLEARGWLCEMLQSGTVDVPAARQPGNLASAVQHEQGAEQLEHWLAQLQGVFERMGDSLDEY